jgi:glycosyltransferase involved in cell wall biosynthesis
VSNRRIAYLTSEYPAPSHTFIRREVEALRARGISIQTFSIRRPAANARFAPADRDAQRTTTYLLPIGAWALVKAHVVMALQRPWAYITTFRKALRHRVPGIRALLWALFHFAEAVVLAARFKDSRIDHLHNHFANASANVGLLASQFLGIPWSMTLHGTADWDYPAGCLLPDKIKVASFVACVSAFGRAQAMLISPTETWGKIFVARCGVDLSALPPKQHATKPSGPLRIVAVGRLSPEKGQVGLLHAFATLVNRGIEAELQIIGDGPLRDSLSETISQLGIRDRCVLVGQKTEAEVLEFLADADLFVQSSLMEGLPVVLIESLAMQIPVIAPCVAGIPELVCNGETGLLFTAGDWDQLAAQMERASLDPALRRSIGERGHLEVMRRFDIRRAIEPLAQRFLCDDLDFNRRCANKADIVTSNVSEVGISSPERHQNAIRAN